MSNTPVRSTFRFRKSKGGDCDPSVDRSSRIELDVSLLLNVTMELLLKKKKHAEERKSLSSTYRSFRDSDTSLFSSIPVIDENSPSITKFHTIHSQSPVVIEDLSSLVSVASFGSTGTIRSDPEDVGEPLASVNHIPNSRLLVYNCLKAFGHGQWFNHWRKCLSLNDI